MGSDTGKKIFVVISGGMIIDPAHSTLRSACKAAGISYWTAARQWKGKYTGKSATIMELKIKKIKRRGPIGK